MTFTSHILQRDRSETVLLIHGMFTNAGFWLPALRFFPRHRLVLLNVDYIQYFTLANGISALSDFLHCPRLGLGDQVQIIGHSYGSVLAASVMYPATQRYLLCPVFLAESVDLSGFSTALASKDSGKTTESGSVQLLLEQALSEARKVDKALIAARGDLCLIPDSDIFFQYRNLLTSGACYSYPGDHFEVLNPVSQFFVN